MQISRFYLLATLLTVCFVSQANPPTEKSIASVTGQVIYRERIALQPDSVVTVKLVDVSRADAKATLLAEQRITNPGSVPVPFKLDYDPGVIDARMSYAVQAQIHDASKKLLWTTTEHIGVITRENPKNNIDARVHPVNSGKNGFPAPEK